MAHTPGMPSWADLTTSDLTGAIDFYAKVFGWTPVTAPEPDAGGYTNFLMDGKPVAGAGPSLADDQPPAWTVYFATDDADATTAKVQQAGGRVLVEPMEVTGYGRMAVYTDQAGAAFAVWQAGEHAGAELVHEPNSLDWDELMTGDPEGAKEFYSQVFGWEPHPTQMGEHVYTMFTMGENPAGGMMPMPTNTPAQWMTYFSVTDCDGICTHVERLGGRVTVPPTDIPPGRFAVLGDPQGASFAIIQNNPEFRM
jgi:uncharacterized protein